MKTVNWSIKGMGCGTCVRKIKASHIREPGVQDEAQQVVGAAA